MGSGLEVTGDANKASGWPSGPSPTRRQQRASPVGVPQLPGQQEGSTGVYTAASSSDGGAPLVRQDGLGPSVVEPCGVPAQAGQCGFLVGSSQSTGWAWPPRSPPLEPGPALPTLASVAPCRTWAGRGQTHRQDTLCDPSMALATDTSGQWAREAPPSSATRRSVAPFPVLLRSLLHSGARSGVEAVSPPVLTLPLALPPPRGALAAPPGKRWAVWTEAPRAGAFPF